MFCMTDYGRLYIRRMAIKDQPKPVQSVANKMNVRRSDVFLDTCLPSKCRISDYTCALIIRSDIYKNFSNFQDKRRFRVYFPHATLFYITGSQ